MSSNETTTVAATPDTHALTHEATAQLRYDLILTGLLLAVTVIYLVQAFLLPADSPNQADVGPRVYPLLLGVLLSVSTVALAVSTIVRWRHRVYAPKSQKADRYRPLIRVAAIVVVSVVYILIMDPLGFVIASFLLLVALSIIIGGYHGAKAAALTVVFGSIASVVIYLVFARALGVLLPQGILPF